MQNELLSLNDYALILNITKKHFHNLTNSNYKVFVDRSQYRLKFEIEKMLIDSKTNNFMFDFENSSCSFFDRMMVDNMTHILKYEYVTASQIRQHIYPLTHDQLRLLRLHKKINYLETEEHHITRKFKYSTKDLLDKYYGTKKSLLGQSSLIPSKQFYTRTEVEKILDITNYTFKKYSNLDKIPVVTFGNAIRIPILEFQQFEISKSKDKA